MAKHSAIIKGDIHRKLYVCRRYDTHHWCNAEPYIAETSEKISDKVIWEGDLDLPIMKSGDVIHIADLKTTVHITGCLRTTENKFIYSTSHIIETIEDELTEESKLHAEETFNHYTGIRKENEEVHVKLPWYKRLFN